MRAANALIELSLFDSAIGTNIETHILDRFTAQRMKLVYIRGQSFAGPFSWWLLVLDY